MPSKRGSAAPTRAGSEPRRPCSSASSHAMIDARTRPPPRRRNGSGGSFGTRRVTSGRRVSSSSTPSASRDRIWPPSQLGPDAVAGVAGAVVDPRARHGAEERQVVGRDVDRPAPGVGHLRLLEARQQAPQAALGARDRRLVLPEAVVDAARRSRSGPSRCPSARGRRSSCGSSAGTCGRRARPRPRSSRSARAAPAPARSARRTSRRRSAGGAAASSPRPRRSRPRPPRAPARGRARCAPRRPRSPSRASARAGAPCRARPAAARARDGPDGRSRRRAGTRRAGRRAIGSAPTSSSVESATASSGTPSSRAASTSSSTAGILGRRGRDAQHPALAQPGVDAVAPRRRRGRRG